MATFPAITPTYGAQKSSRPNVRTVQFGDGYQARLTYGLNQNPKSWSLTWEVSETDADTIETFLNNRAADNASFDWTPLDDSTSYKWICPEWNKSVPYKNRATITATFQQVFEP
jgi:phage-related protein